MTDIMYIVEVTEHEYEAGWGAAVRPSGYALCRDKDLLVKYFDTKMEQSMRQDSSEYQLYFTINEPKMCSVTEAAVQYAKCKYVNWFDKKDFDKYVKEMLDGHFKE